MFHVKHFDFLDILTLPEPFFHGTINLSKKPLLFW